MTEYDGFLSNMDMRRDSETKQMVRELLGMKERLRSLRDRLCDEKNNKNPRYHGFSLAISGINRAIYDMEEEERN